MNSFNEFFLIGPELMVLLAINLVIALVLLGAVRYVAGFWAGVNTTEELSQRDNFAFGISMAGSVLALGIALTGAVTGESANSYITEAIGVTTYGVFALVLIKLGRFVHDKLALNELDKLSEIKNQNVSVAIVDAGASIATAIIIRSVLLWAEGLDHYTAISVLSGFVVSQMMLVLVTRLRENTYRKLNQDASMQSALMGGQIAVALRHSGHLIATAMAVSAASNFLVYEPTSIVMNLVGWLFISIIMSVIIFALGKVVKKVILAGIDVAAEIDQQHNIGVAAIEMALVISVSFVISALMA